jgi:uncharacterized protein YdhG (YjbR/CyaY superfamily)
VTVDAYLATLRDDQRAVLQRLRRIIRAVTPRMEEAVSYGMPASGSTVVGWYGRRQRTALRDYGVRAVGDELAGYDVSGRGTLRFRPDY